MSTLIINNRTNNTSAQSTAVNIPPYAAMNFGTLVKLFKSLTASASEPSSPAEGDVYYDDGTNTDGGEPAFRRYNGSAWKDITGGGEDVNYYICADT